MDLGSNLLTGSIVAHPSAWVYQTWACVRLRGGKVSSEDFWSIAEFAASGVPGASDRDGGSCLIRTLISNLQLANRDDRPSPGTRPTTSFALLSFSSIVR